MLCNIGGIFMYESTNIAEIIKKTAKAKNIQLKDMLLELALNRNTFSNMYKGSMLKSDSLAKIADYLGCSVDYLLGRTNVPFLATNVINGNVIDGTVVQASHHNHVIVNNSKRNLTDEEEELLRLFNSLDVKQRIKILDLAFKLEKACMSKKSE